MYRDGRHEEALGFYTEALAMAKTKTQKIALHSNRAACYLKLHDFKKAAEECTSVLDLDYMHTGALMLRAQTLVTLKEYQSALFDVNRLMEFNPSSEVYQNLHARLKTQLSLAPIPESEAELEEEDEDKNEAEPTLSEEEPVEEEEPAEEEVIDALDATLGREHQSEPERTIHVEVTVPQTQSIKDSSDQNSKGWQTIPKPKGHSNLDYSRWDQVEDDSSDEDDDDEEESQPQYRFRVKRVGVQPVK